MKVAKTKKGFYNRYHKQNADFFKVISDNNATYYYLLPVVRRAINRIKTKQLNCIDVGCGVGTLAFYLAKKGINVSAYDVSSSAITICNRYKEYSGIKKIKFIQANIETVNTYKKYDLLICTEVIEHLRNDRKFIKKLCNLCAKKGRLVLSTPSENAPLYKLGLLDGFDLRVGHLRRYNTSNLTKILNECGFEIEEFHKVEGLFRNSFYTIKPLGMFLRLVKGPLVPLFHFIDMVSVNLFGESDLIVLARKKE